jgi:hypothetical protein
MIFVVGLSTFFRCCYMLCHLNSARMLWGSLVIVATSGKNSKISLGPTMKFEVCREFNGTHTSVNPALLASYFSFTSESY